MKKKRIVIAERNIYGSLWFYLGLLLTPLSLFLFWASSAWGEPGFLKLGLIFVIIGPLLVVWKRTVVLEREIRTIVIKSGPFGFFTSRYSLDNYKTIGFGWGSYGPDYTSMDNGLVTNSDYESIVLIAKKGKGKDLVLYEALFPAIRGHWLHRMEKKRIERITDIAIRFLQLPLEKYGP
jgi:hypothetical protein